MYNEVEIPKISSSFARPVRNEIEDILFDDDPRYPPQKIISTTNTTTRKFSSFAKPNFPSFHFSLSLPPPPSYQRDRKLTKFQRFQTFQAQISHPTVGVEFRCTRNPFQCVANERKRTIASRDLGIELLMRLQFDSNGYLGLNPESHDVMRKKRSTFPRADTCVGADTKRAAMRVRSFTPLSRTLNRLSSSSLSSLKMFLV